MQTKLIWKKNLSGPEIIKLFYAQLNLARISTAQKTLKYQQMKQFFASSLSDVVFIMLLNVKMPTIASILTLMSRINFVRIWVEHEKRFITLSSAWKKFYNPRGQTYVSPNLTLSLKCFNNIRIYGEDLNNK